MVRPSIGFMLMAALVVSCDRAPTPRAGSSVSSRGEQQPATGGGTNRQTFQVRGVVLQVHPEKKEVEIRHEEIPGYMPAMTMPFEVRNTKELAGLEAGDVVKFIMIVTDTDGWIEQIRKIQSGVTATNTSLSTTGQFRLVREVEPLNTGDRLPEYHLTNQVGQPFSTTDFKGQALAVTFLFTRCPFPTFCPLMSSSFEEAQQKMLANSTGPTNWHLLTISFDPEFDKPAVLKAYAERYKYDPTRWSFATGELIDITAIAEQFGLTFWHDETGSISHNLRMVVIDATGRVQKIYTGNKWTSDELVNELQTAARKK